MNLFLREFGDNQHGGPQNRLQLMNPSKVMDTLKTFALNELKWETTPLAGVRKLIIECMHGPFDPTEGLVDVVCQAMRAPASVDKIALALQRARKVTAQATDGCKTVASNGVFGNSWDSFWTDGSSITMIVIKRMVKALVYGWNSLPVAVKLGSGAFVVWRLFCSLRSEWKQSRICYDGQDDITFCATCSPELLDPSCMVLGNAYEKKFHVPSKCPRCSWCWQWAGWKNATMRIDNVHYQFLGTYSAMRMQRERDVHCPVANQLDVTHEYMFAHRFMQFHAGTIGEMQKRSRWTWSFHTRSYCLATGWQEILGGDATQYKPRVKPGAKPSEAPVAPGPTPPDGKQIPPATKKQRQAPLKPMPGEELEVVSTASPAAETPGETAPPPSTTTAQKSQKPSAAAKTPQKEATVEPSVPKSEPEVAVIAESKPQDESVKTKAPLVRAGSLLDVSDGYIAHQCNCVMWEEAQGIASAIFGRFPEANVYGARAVYNTDPNIPGTNTLHGRIINMYGQLLPGQAIEKKTKGYNVQKYAKQKEANKDTSKMRQSWFGKCLADLPSLLPEGPQIVNFPKLIGCGKAGGDWAKYLKMIEDFSAKHPDWTVRVFDHKQKAQSQEPVSEEKVVDERPAAAPVITPMPKVPPPTYVPVVPEGATEPPPPPQTHAEAPQGVKKAKGGTVTFAGMDYFETWEDDCEFEELPPVVYTSDDEEILSPPPDDDEEVMPRPAPTSAGSSTDHTKVAGSQKDAAERLFQGLDYFEAWDNDDDDEPPPIVDSSDDEDNFSPPPDDDEDPPPAKEPDPAPCVKLSPINKMRQLWQFIYDNGGRYPQSTMWKCAYDRCRELFNITGRSLVFDASDHFRLANIMGLSKAWSLPTRLLDCEYMSPPPDSVMVPVAADTAQVVGPVTQPITVHNAGDKVSVMAALEHRSDVKCSVFADADGTYPKLEFKKHSSAARRLDRFWRRFYKVVLTNKAIDNAYQKLFADKDFREIAMSKFSPDEIERIKHELETTTRAEELENRKANGKNEIVLKELKAARLVVDNGLKLVALNIITCKIFQHLIFDSDDGIFYDMSIKGRDRSTVLDAFGAMMGRPFDTDEPLCAWEIDQTGMELHERCNQKGEGILGYTYDALMRIDQRVSHKLNGQFSNLHEAKTVFDVKKGMRLRFRVKDPDVPMGMWFTAKFPDMYLDSGWLLTSGVNFMNELSAVLSTFTSNPEHIFAINGKTGEFCVKEKTFKWEFKSIPMYQTEESTEVSVFAIRLRGIIEGDDGAGAASRCLADPRNGGKFGLIVAALEDLGYSGKLEVMVHGRLELIGAHYPVKDGKVSKEVPWCPAVSRYISKLGTHTHNHITPATQAARFLSLASMFAGRIEPLQRGFEAAAERVIEMSSSRKTCSKGDAKAFWNETIKTDGYDVIDRAFGSSEHTNYTLKEIESHYRRMAHIVPPRSEVQIRMLNMSVAKDPRSNDVTRDDFSKLGLFAEECGHFDGDHEAAYAFIPASLR